MSEQVITDDVSGRKIYVDSDQWNDAIVKEFGNVELNGTIEKYFWEYESLNKLEAIRGRASIDELIDFANQVRLAGNGEVIDKLLMSVPQDPENCVIANALNFDSEVSDNFGPWAMEPENNKLVEPICEAMGLEIVYRYSEDEIDEGFVPADDNYAAAIKLPKNIYQVAEAFDTRLDVELEQYSVIRNNNEDNPLL